MAETSNKVLYIDNISTYNYVKTYRDLHVIDDPKTSKFTYVVFSEYERPNNYGSSYHGDIFFNGSKITYINDVDVTSPVTDGKDIIIGYITNNSVLNFAKGSIILDGLANKYDLFNIIDNKTSYNYISDLGLYTVEEEGTWNSEIINGSGNIKIKDGLITCERVDGSVNIHLSYTFKLNPGTSYEKTCTAYAYYNIYNLVKADAVSFGDTPTTFSYQTIYTPQMIVTPNDAKQIQLTFSSSDSNVVEILNERTGTFKCNKPGTSTIICSYTGESVTHVITVSKLNPHLSITAYATTYLWNESEYQTTCCYAHYDTLGMPVTNSKWYLNTTNNSYGSNPIKSNTINYNNLTTSGINVIYFDLPSDYYYPCTAAKQLYASNQETLRTGEIVINDYNVDTNTNTVSFVIAATPVGNNIGFVDTNYSFDNSLGISNFTTYDIVYDSSTNTTYTHVIATVNNNIINEIYAQYSAAYNNSNNQSNTPIICYNIINVYTTDESFVSYQYSEEYTMSTEMYDALPDDRLYVHI